MLPVVANNLEEQTTKTKLAPDPYHFDGKWEKLKRKIKKKKNECREVRSKDEDDVNNKGDMTLVITLKKLVMLRECF